MLWLPYLEGNLEFSYLEQTFHGKNSDDETHDAKGLKLKTLSHGRIHSYSGMQLNRTQISKDIGEL